MFRAFFNRVSLVRSLYLNRKLTRVIPWLGLNSVERPEDVLQGCQVPAVPISNG